MKLFLAFVTTKKKLQILYKLKKKNDSIALAGDTSDETKIFFWILKRIGQSRSERIFEHLPRKLTEI